MVVVVFDLSCLDNVVVVVFKNATPFEFHQKMATMGSCRRRRCCHSMIDHGTPCRLPLLRVFVYAFVVWLIVAFDRSCDHAVVVVIVVVVVVVVVSFKRVDIVKFCSGPWR
jgi:hypothetical protein